MRSAGGTKGGNSIWWPSQFLRPDAPSQLDPPPFLKTENFLLHLSGELVRTPFIKHHLHNWSSRFDHLLVTPLKSAGERTVSKGAFP